MQNTHPKGDSAMLDVDHLYCPECADVRAVEIPDCADGHGRDCPERACASCGAALWLDPPVQRHRVSTRATRAATRAATAA